MYAVELGPGEEGLRVDSWREVVKSCKVVEPEAVAEEDDEVRMTSDRGAMLEGKARKRKERVEGKEAVELESRRRARQTRCTLLPSSHHQPDISFSPKSHSHVQASSLPYTLLPLIGLSSRSRLMDSPDSPPGTLLDWEEDQVCFWLDKVGYSGHDAAVRGKSTPITLPLSRFDLTRASLPLQIKPSPATSSRSSLRMICEILGFLPWVTDSAFLRWYTSSRSHRVCLSKTGRGCQQVSPASPPLASSPARPLFCGETFNLDTAKRESTDIGRERILSVLCFSAVGR